MRRLPVFSMALCVVRAVAAQPDTLGVYFPITVGNQWVFEHRYFSGMYVTHHRWTVLADSQTAAGRAVRIQIASFVPGSPDSTRATCVIDYSFSDTPWLAGWYDHPGCLDVPNSTAATPSEFWLKPGTDTETIAIGDSTYVTRTTYGGDYYTGGGGSWWAADWMFGRNIGPIRFENYSGTSGSSGSGSRYLLKYAQVDGTTFGSPVAPFPNITPERFYPLGIGDLWVYGERASSSGTQTTLTGYVERQVVGDSVIGGTAFRLLRERQYTTAGVLTDTRRCAVRATGTWFEWVAIDGECAPIEESAGDASWTVPLSATEWYEYDCEVAGPLVLPACLAMRGQGGWPPVRTQSMRFGADLGFMHYGDLFQYGPSFQRNLVHAIVGDLTYGQHPVAADPRPLAAEFAIRVRPNPVVDGARIDFALPVSSHVHAEVFDALGRRVYNAILGLRAAGVHVTIVASGAWAPGLYVARLTTDDGRTATARFIRAGD